MATDPKHPRGFDPPEVPQRDGGVDANLNRELELDEREAAPDGDRLVEGGPEDTQGAGRREEYASPPASIGDDGFDDHER